MCTIHDAVKNRKHTDGHHLGAQVQNVKTDEAVFNVDVGLLGKGVVRTRRKQLDLYRQLLCFGFRLLLEVLHKVNERRWFALIHSNKD